MLDTSKLYKPGPSPDEKTCLGCETSYRVTSDGSHAPDCPVGLLERMTFHAAISDGFRDGDSSVVEGATPEEGARVAVGTIAGWFDPGGNFCANRRKWGRPELPETPDEYPVGRDHYGPRFELRVEAPAALGLRFDTALVHGLRAVNAERDKAYNARAAATAAKDRAVGLANLTALAPDLTGEALIRRAVELGTTTRDATPAPYAVVTYATARPGVTLLVWRVFAALDPAYVAVLVPSPALESSVFRARVREDLLPLLRVLPGVSAFQRLPDGAPLHP